MCQDEIDHSCGSPVCESKALDVVVVIGPIVSFMLDLLNATQGINAIDRLVLAHGLLKCSRVIIREWSLRAEPAAHAVCSRRRLVCVT